MGKVILRCVRVRAILTVNNLATPGVGLLALCRMASLRPLRACHETLSRRWDVRRRDTRRRKQVSYLWHYVLFFAQFAFFRRHRGDMRRDAWRQFLSIASYGVLRVIFALFGILCQPWYDRCRVAWRSVAGDVWYDKPTLIMCGVLLPFHCAPSWFVV